MKLHLNKTEILPLLTRINNIVDQKSPQKIRSHILIQALADSSKVRFVGADSEIRIEGDVLGAVDIPGSITVNCQRFFECIRNAPNQEIEIQTIEGALLITSMKSKVQLATMPAEDFPLAESHAFEHTVSIPIKQFLWALSTVKISMAVNDIRHYLNGLLIHFKQNEIVFASTEGHRLSVSEIENITDLNDNKAILPRKTVIEFCGWLVGQEGEIVLQLSDTHLSARVGSISLTSSLVNGDFPNYESVIPEESDLTKVIIPKVQLKEGLTRAKILYTDQSIGVTLTFEPWCLSLCAKNRDNESAEDKLDINYDGEEKKVAFNILYLLEILTALNGDNVVMYVQDGQSSVLIMDPENNNSRYVIMPMNI